ncbi:MAG: PEP-utilizing enzyme [Patescibacteria group bacterium]
MALKFFLDRDKMYPYPFYIADLALMLDMQPIAGQNLTKSFCVFERNRIYMHYDVDSIDGMGLALLDKILKNDGFYEEVIRQIYGQSQKMEEFTEQTNSLDVAMMSDAELVDWYAKYMQHTRDLRSWGWVPPMIDGMDKPHLSNYLENKLREFLRDKASDQQTVEYFSLLTTSDTPSEVQQEELARLELLLEMQEHPELRDTLLSKHLDVYGWLTYGYSGPAMTQEYLLKALKSTLESGDPKDQIRSFQKRYENIKSQKQDLLQKLNLPADLVRLFGITSKFMAIKDFRKGVYQRSYLAMDRVIAEIAKRLNLDLKSVKFMLFEEIKDALMNQRQAFYKPIVVQRLEKCCLIAENGEFKIYQGQACDDQITKLVGKHPADVKSENVKELKGSVAYAGHAKGMVKIVLVVEDVDKVNEGDILVSSATNPDLIVAMKRAAAFVTDTGGITSHAAIVARELKKPCVVGTGKATRVLKDGDLVEVDADKGIVWIVEN